MITKEQLMNGTPFTADKKSKLIYKYLGYKDDKGDVLFRYIGERKKSDEVKDYAYAHGFLYVNNDDKLVIETLVIKLL